MKRIDTHSTLPSQPKCLLSPQSSTREIAKPNGSTATAVSRAFSRRDIHDAPSHDTRFGSRSGCYRTSLVELFRANEAQSISKWAGGLGECANISGGLGTFSFQGSVTQGLATNQTSLNPTISVRYGSHGLSRRLTDMPWIRLPASPPYLIFHNPCVGFDWTVAESENATNLI
jgi:hypothetical protein